MNVSEAEDFLRTGLNEGFNEQKELIPEFEVFLRSLSYNEDFTERDYFSLPRPEQGFLHKYWTHLKRNDWRGSGDRWLAFGRGGYIDRASGYEIRPMYYTLSAALIRQIEEDHVRLWRKRSRLWRQRGKYTNSLVAKRLPDSHYVDWYFDRHEDKFVFTIYCSLDGAILTTASVPYRMIVSDDDTDKKSLKQIRDSLVQMAVADSEEREERESRASG